MTYIVWCEGSYSNWTRSDDLDTMADCFEYIRTQTYGHPYIITRPVGHELVEVDLSRFDRPSVGKSP